MEINLTGSGRLADTLDGELDDDELLQQAMPLLSRAAALLCQVCESGRKAAAAAGGSSQTEEGHVVRQDQEALCLTYRILAGCVTRLASRQAAAWRAALLAATSRHAEYASACPDVSSASPSSPAAHDHASADAEAENAARLAWVSMLDHQLSRITEPHIAAALLALAALVQPSATSHALHPFHGALALGLSALRTVFPSHDPDLARLLPPVPTPLSSRPAVVSRKDGALGWLVHFCFAQLGTARGLFFCRALLRASIDMLDAATPASHPALPLLRRGALPSLVLSSLGRITQVCVALPRATSPAELPFALVDFCRACALGASALELMLCLLREAHGESRAPPFGAALCTSCAAFSTALIDSLRRAIACRCLPGSTCSSSALSRPLALATHLLQLQRAVCTELRRNRGADAIPFDTPTAPVTDGIAGGGPRARGGLRLVGGLRDRTPASRRTLQGHATRGADRDAEAEGDDGPDYEEDASVSDDESGTYVRGDVVLGRQQGCGDACSVWAGQRAMQTGAQHGVPRVLFALERLQQLLLEIKLTQHVPPLPTSPGRGSEVVSVEGDAADEGEWVGAAGRSVHRLLAELARSSGRGRHERAKHASENEGAGEGEVSVGEESEEEGEVYSRVGGSDSDASEADRRVGSKWRRERRHALEAGSGPGDRACLLYDLGGWKQLGSGANRSGEPGTRRCGGMMHSELQAQLEEDGYSGVSEEDDEEATVGSSSETQGESGEEAVLTQNRSKCSHFARLWLARFAASQGEGAEPHATAAHDEPEETIFVSFRKKPRPAE